MPGSDLAVLEGVGSFNRLLGDIVNLGGPGTNAAAVVHEEVGHLLETCIRYTPTARAQVIDQRTLYKERKLYSAYSGGLTGKEARAQEAFISNGQQNTRAWYVTPNYTGRVSTVGANGRRKPRRHFDSAGNVTHAWHLMNGNRHWPDALWAEYQREESDRQQDYATHLAEEKRAGRASRGLSARSWLDIADALGIDVKIAEYVRRAVPSNGKSYINGAGRPFVDGDTSGFILENFQPILLAPRSNDSEPGASILQRAMATRGKAFDIAVEKGLFLDMTFLAKRYPSLLAA